MLEKRRGKKKRSGEKSGRKMNERTYFFVKASITRKVPVGKNE